MGLDMTMYRNHYVGNKYNDEKDRLKISSKGRFDHIEEEKIAYIKEEIGDWRKFNSLHGWMVDNVQNGNDNCGTYEVDSDKLKELLDIIQRIQANHQLAAKLLPARQGFFFGATGNPKEDYDEYYFENIDYTEKVLKEALSNPCISIEYSSSW